MSNDPLYSPKLKIERAKTLIQEADARVSDYTGAVDCTLVVGPHPNEEGQSVAISKVAEAVPVEIALIVGDAIHSLRTALDHLVGCLSVANGKSLKGVSFPFDANAKGFAISAPKKIKKLTPAAQKLIYRMKPYGGGNNFLYLLNKLDVRDKHQTLSLCAAYLGGWNGQFSCDHPIQVSTEPFGSLNEGVHIFTFPSEAKFEHNLKITFSVAFADIEGTEGQPVSIILHEFVDLTERIIGIFERRFFR